MVTNGDSSNITNGDNDDPLKKMMIHWSYNGGNVDNKANGDNGFIGSSGFIGTSGVIGTNGINEWQCVLHISHAPLHIEINDANESPFAPLDLQCC